jgi:hypothetical protein
MTGSVLKAAKQKANALSITAGTKVKLTFVSQTEVQEEANQMNMTAVNQSVICAKEGVLKALTKLVGSNTTSTVHKTSNCSNHNSIDNCTLFKLMTAAVDCRPAVYK